MGIEPVLIVGAGRVRHGDDAVGILVARVAWRSLAGKARALIDLGGWDALDALEGRRLLIVVDAAQADPTFQPGRWRRIDYRADPRALLGCPLRDTHTAGVAAMLGLAAGLGTLPPEVWVYAIAANHFEPEQRTSAAVREAARAVLADILARVTQ